LYTGTFTKLKLLEILFYGILLTLKFSQSMVAITELDDKILEHQEAQYMQN